MLWQVLGREKAAYKSPVLCCDLYEIHRGVAAVKCAFTEQGDKQACSMAL